MLDVDVEDQRDVGLDDRGKARISPRGWCRIRAPPRDAPSVSVSSVIGTPIRLLRLPGVDERFAEQRARQRGSDFLGGGFARRTADRDEGNRMDGAKPMHMMIREASERDEGVIDLDAWNAAMCRPRSTSAASGAMLGSLR